MAEREKGLVKALPKKLKVGYVDYRIEDWDTAQADASARYGETDRVRRIVRVDTTHSSQQSAETLLHEVLHCVYSMWNLPGDKDKEEKIITAMASGLATVWRDNPDVFSWIDMNLVGQPIE